MVKNEEFVGYFWDWNGERVWVLMGFEEGVVEREWREDGVWNNDNNNNNTNNNNKKGKSHDHKVSLEKLGF